MKSTARSPNIRISPRAHELLRQLAKEEQQSMQSVMEDAIERHRRERFLGAANADFAALKADQKSWKRGCFGILDPIEGHEQAGSRPALILSVDLFNEGPAELVVAVPLTRTQQKIRWHVIVRPPEAGLTAGSFIQCENLRSVSKRRLKRLQGRVSPATLEQVEDRVRILLGV